ncbi:MAG: 4Fe-4S single cluster domain-containing protein, partial [Terriglobia bacterium]
PGLRAVVFFQGCSLGCAGCWNPSSHAFRGTDLGVEDVAEKLLRAHTDYVLEGVTFSGGEPMQQAENLLGLIKHLQRVAPALSFGMFSGYAERELDHGRYWIRKPLSVSDKQLLWQEIRARLDFAVLGRFNESQPSRESLVTSRNQDLRLFSNRYSSADFIEQSVEVSIDESGLTHVTGFPVLGLPF